MNRDDYEREAFQRMVKRGQLPVPTREEHAQVMAKVGFRFEGTGASRYAVLPPGWQVVQFKNCFGKIVDRKGHTRGGVFYRQVTDVSATGHSWIEARFVIALGDRSALDWHAFDRQAQEVVFTDDTTYGDARFNKVKAWLDQQFPAWRDPSQYWDDAAI